MSAPAIGIGRAVRNSRVERVDLDATAPIEALGLALHLHAGRGAWWCPSTHDGRRAHENWRGAHVLAVDVDHEGAHKGGSWPRRERLRARRALARSPGTLAHLTPRGLRVIALLDEEIRDATVFAGASAAFTARVAAWLALERLEGLAVDEGASCDRSRLLYTPRATIETAPRRACIVRGAAGVIALDDLLRANDEVSERAAIAGEAPLFAARGEQLVRPDRVARARAWLARAKPAINGEGGSRTAFRTIERVVRGFDLADAEALDALADWNARCSPPWDTSPEARQSDSLVRLIRRARERGDTQTGELLDARRDREPALSTNVAGATTAEHRDGPMPVDDSDVSATQQADPKQAEVVIRIVCENTELFHDTKSNPFAIVKVAQRRAVFPLRSRPMKSWIARTVRAALGHCVGSTTIEEALVNLDGIARFDRDQRPVHLRVAEHDGSIYVDLGDETGACVEVTAKGWSIRGEAPVMFRRPDAMLPLPRPSRGGKLEELRPFFNAADDAALYLFVAWTVAALRPGRPFPIMALHGEQGTAKSTAARVARALVDPSKAPIRSAPRTEDDLAVGTVHSHVLAYDNLSGVPPWLSDALCRLATGGGLSKRTLYSDDDETVIEAMRPIIVNGIDDVANRADLAERCLVLTLQPIPKSKRRDERSFWRAFDSVAPRLLGVLLDGVASALRNLPEVERTLTELPRMADFALWIAAAEPGLGLPAKTLLDAYERNRAKAVDIALDASPVATAVRALLDKPAQRGRWEGTPEQCLAALTDIVPDPTRRTPGWPKSARALSSALKRSATFLRTVGVDLDLDGHEGRDKHRHRIYRLARREGTGETVPIVPASPSAENRRHGGDATADPDRPQDRPHDGARTFGDELWSPAARRPTPPEARENGRGGRGDDGDGPAVSFDSAGHGCTPELGRTCPACGLRRLDDVGRCGACGTQRAAPLDDDSFADSV